jgi:hypothetical protein
MLGPERTPPSQQLELPQSVVVEVVAEAQQPHNRLTADLVVVLVDSRRKQPEQERSVRAMMAEQTQQMLFHSAERVVAVLAALELPQTTELGRAVLD